MFQTSFENVSKTRIWCDEITIYHHPEINKHLIGVARVVLKLTKHLNQCIEKVSKIFTITTLYLIFFTFINSGHIGV